MKRLKQLAYFVIACIVVYSCQHKNEQKKIVRPVKIFTISAGNNRTAPILLPATIYEKRETKLAFRVKGPLLLLNDTIGDFIKQGQVIAKIDQRDYKIAVESTQAGYKLAKAEYQRYKSLLEKESVAKSTFDKIESNYINAKTAYESAQNALFDTELKAPFSGHISSVFVNNFEEVNPGQAIVTFIDLSKLEVKAWVSLQDLNQITTSTQFTCLLEQGDTKIRVPATLKEVGQKTVDSKQSYPVSVLINNSTELNLRSGMVAHLEIVNQSQRHSDAMQIPLSCLFTKSDRTFVWILNERTNTVSKKEIKSGRLLSNDMVEVTKGLRANEKIVSTGVNYLTEGEEVKKYVGFSKTNIGNKL